MINQFINSLIDYSYIQLIGLPINHLFDPLHLQVQPVGLCLHRSDDFCSALQLTNRLPLRNNEEICLGVQYHVTTNLVSMYFRDCTGYFLSFLYVYVLNFIFDFLPLELVDQYFSREMRQGNFPEKYACFKCISSNMVVL